jgi:hypothetical protein
MRAIGNIKNIKMWSAMAEEGLSQTQLADKAGVCGGVINGMLTERKSSYPKNKVRVAAALNRTLEQVGLNGDKIQPPPLLGPPQGPLHTRGRDDTAMMMSCTKELRQRIRDAAEDRHMSLSDWMREAVETHLDLRYGLVTHPRTPPEIPYSVGRFTEPDTEITLGELLRQAAIKADSMRQ